MRPLRMVVATTAFAVFVSSAVAQSVNTAPPPAGAVHPPEVGTPLFPATDTGLDKVAGDGVSTRTVRAAPCSTSARETDGTTTCIGIPGPVREREFRDGAATGMSK